MSLICNSLLLTLATLYTIHTRIQMALNSVSFQHLANDFGDPSAALYLSLSFTDCIGAITKCGREFSFPGAAVLKF